MKLDYVNKISEQSNQIKTLDIIHSYLIKFDTPFIRRMRNELKMI